MPHDHSHTHDARDSPASAAGGRALRIGIGGPVGSGKTALVAALCRTLGDELRLGVVTNDIYTEEDAEFLRRAGVLADDRIVAVQTGCCPHTAIRDDISANLEAVEDLEARHRPLDLVLVESGGDNLTATFSRGLVDRQVFVIDVAGGDKVPRKGGPGVTSADLLVVNKTDLAALVGADLGVMDRDARARRGTGPVLFSSLVEDPGASEAADWVRAQLAAWVRADLRAEPAEWRDRPAGPDRADPRAEPVDWQAEPVDLRAEPAARREPSAGPDPADLQAEPAARRDRPAGPGPAG